MLRNIKITIEYDGTDYCGWQVQNNSQFTAHSLQKRKRSIQDVIEKALFKILNEKVKITASGRTDAGVHAKGQVANFFIKSSISLARLQEGLNAILSDDITIISIRKAKPDFHSRFSAKSKIYRYSILNQKHRSSILRKFTCFCRYPLDLKLMRQEAKLLLGKHDFSAFCAAGGKKKNPLRTIKKISVSRQGNLINIDIEANSFLYNMVRNIAGTLIDIGRGRLPRGAVKKILRSCDRRQAGATAAAKGLCLMKVKY